MNGVGVDDDEAVKRSTAVRHLVEIGEIASERLGLRETEIGWPLEELWVAGELLSAAESFDAGSVLIVLDVPADELPWLAIHPVGEWVGEQLRLGKRPLYWCYRPLGWPPWNHRHRRVVRVWSATTGLDDAVIDGLRTRIVDELVVVEPSSDALVSQLDQELAVSRQHLRSVLNRYWNRDWRHDLPNHFAAEDHLSRAAMAVSEIQDTLDELG